MSYEQTDALTAPISTLPVVTLDQWLSKRDAWLESTEILVRLWFENELGSRADLARHLGMAKSTITHHCNKLIEAGCTAIPSSKGQGQRRDLEQVEPVQEAEVIDISSTVELLEEEAAAARLKRAEDILAAAKKRRRDLDRKHNPPIDMAAVDEIVKENLAAIERKRKSSSGFTLDSLIEYVEAIPNANGALGGDPMYHDLQRLANAIADRL